MIKILSIVWYKVLPAKFGGQKGIAGFNNELARDYPLVCLCSSNNEAGQEINYKVIPELPVNKKQFLSPRCWETIKRVAVREKPSHIILEHPYHGIAAWKASRAVGAKLILHAHNIESLRFRQLGKPWWWPLYYFEKWVMRKAGLVLFKTIKDREAAIDHFGLKEDKCLLIPYGIEKKPSKNRREARKLIIERHGINPQEKILLFAGSLDYLPNYKAVEDIVSNIIPALERQELAFRILVTGKSNKTPIKIPPNSNNVSFIGEVNDIENYFSAADAFINPVKLGGGTQTKNIDALAYHCNLVCFGEMMDAELVSKGGNKIFLSANDWNAFAKQVILATQYTGDTPESFFDQYDWHRITSKLKERIHNI